MGSRPIPTTIIIIKQGKNKTKGVWHKVGNHHRFNRTEFFARYIENTKKEIMMKIMTIVMTMKKLRVNMFPIIGRLL